MLEIILLINVSKKISEIAFDKGYSSGLYKFYTVLFWFGFEIIGGVIALLIFDNQGVAYIIALLSAALGIFILYKITQSLPDKNIE